MSKGTLYIISGPSGAGKGTIYNEVVLRRPHIKKSISVTTRAPREGEIEGVHYYFKSMEEYQEMIARGEFLETAEVYCNCYGTPKAPVIEMLDKGYDVMFEIDIHGAKNIKKQYPDAIAIFLMTPSFEVLEERLRARGTESEDAIARRLRSAKGELLKHKMFDYIVFNETKEKAIEEVVAIIDAEKRRVKNNIEKINCILEGKKD